MSTYIQDQFDSRDFSCHLCSEDMGDLAGIESVHPACERQECEYQDWLATQCVYPEKHESMSPQIPF